MTVPGRFLSSRKVRNPPGVHIIVRGTCLAMPSYAVPDLACA